MKLESQVTSLETSKKLKELGVEQESIWVWAKSPQSAFPEPNIIRRYEYEEGLTFAPAFRYQWGLSAFTASEIFDLIGKVPLFIYPNAGKWLVQASGSNDFYAENLVEALAACLIHLLENKLITL